VSDKRSISTEQEGRSIYTLQTSLPAIPITERDEKGSPGQCSTASISKPHIRPTGERIAKQLISVTLVSLSRKQRNGKTTPPCELTAPRPSPRIISYRAQRHIRSTSTSSPGSNLNLCRPFPPTKLTVNPIELHRKPQAASRKPNPGRNATTRVTVKERKRKSLPKPEAQRVVAQDTDDQKIPSTSQRRPPHPAPVPKEKPKKGAPHPTLPVAETYRRTAVRP
jgi:hypothetical protein